MWQCDLFFLLFLLFFFRTFFGVKSKVWIWNVRFLSNQKKKADFTNFSDLFSYPSRWIQSMIPINSIKNLPISCFFFSNFWPYFLFLKIPVVFFQLTDSPPCRGVGGPSVPHLLDVVLGPSGFPWARKIGRPPNLRDVFFPPDAWGRK